VRRQPSAELEASGVPPREAARRSLGHDEVGGSELWHGQEPSDQGVDAGVRRVGDHAERVTRPAERREVQLEHGDPGVGRPRAERTRTPRMQLDGEHATSRPRERQGERTVAGSEIDDDVSGPHR
jgi:hypothetical protein